QRSSAQTIHPLPLLVGVKVTSSTPSYLKRA
ncbi:MAG: hypothetical protein RLZZ157_1949, partial [Pseudomonadota bacterium]